jgi:hypothetical protein
MAVALALLLAGLALGCERRPPPPAAAPAPGEWIPFTGTWSATGERHTLALGAGRRASIATLSGSLLLAREGALGVGFQARALVFGDTAEGGIGRSVWTDERGDEVYSELKGGGVVGGARVQGTFTGGTGRFAGITGEYRIDWRWVIEAEEGRIAVRADHVEGRARIGAAPERPLR